MKTVYSDLSQIAHIWANQLQENASNSASNFYFDGNVIYSYGCYFPIAKHVVNEAGENATLFTERGYSNTTSKHISIVRQAVNHKNVIYCFNPESTHKQNFKSWQIEVENIGTKLLKAKKPEIYLSEISTIANKANKYAAFFNVAIPEGLQAAISIANKDDYKEYANKKAAFELAEIERHEIELQKRHKKELADWLKGKTNRLYVRNGQDYLRLNEDRIETTQGVKIPLETGKRLWQAIKDNKLQVGAKVLDYTVDAVGKEIKIGCHNFKPGYLINFGKKIFTN